MKGKSSWLALIVFTVAACGSNVGPGDAQYPKLNKNTQRLLDITLVQDPTVKAVFAGIWFASNSEGANKYKCSYSGSAGGVPAYVAYSVRDYLVFSGTGTKLHNQFAFDKYEPGLCGYTFYLLGFRVAGQRPPADEDLFQLIKYKDDPSLPVEASVDIWCYPRSDTIGDWCDTMKAASVQNTGRLEQYQIPHLPTEEQAAAAKANGDKEPPALIGPNTRSLIVRVHDARIN